MDPPSEKNLFEKTAQKIRQFILFQNSWFSWIASSVSFNLISGFRYLQFKPDALHRLDARHLWRHLWRSRVTLNEILWSTDSCGLNHDRSLKCCRVNSRYRSTNIWGPVPLSIGTVPWYFSNKRSKIIGPVLVSIRGVPPFLSCKRALSKPTNDQF